MARKVQQGKLYFEKRQPSRLSALLRLSLFFIYLAVLIVLPPTILFEQYGLILGGLVFIGVLFSFYQHVYAIPKVMNSQPLTKAYSPQIHHMVEELAARLRVKKPQLYYIPHSAINFSAVGISEDQRSIIFTEGAVKKLSRSQWIVVITRALLSLKKGSGSTSLLSSYLYYVNKWLTLPQKNNSIFFRFRKVFVYSFSFFPIVILKPQSLSWLDAQVEQDLHSPDCMKNLYQTIQAQREPVDFQVPFSVEHLFFVPPHIRDPLRQLILDLEDIPRRLEQLKKIEAVAN